MRSLVAVLSLLSCLLFLHSPGAVASGAASDALPRSLDAFYPPQANRPVYLISMLELDSAFSGILVDLLEGDTAGVKGNFEEFKKRYAEGRMMVPEWAHHFPEAPLGDLEQALQTGDRGAVMKAFGEVGKTCHHCHLATMVPVQQRFHWGDFAGLRSKDPLSGQDVEYGRFKKFLSTNLASIGVNLRQGQRDNALRQYREFKARFATLRDSCRSCHDEESRYYVDPDAQSRVDALGQTLEDANADPGKAVALLQAIGRETCSKCHLVHVPAATSQAKGR